MYFIIIGLILIFILNYNRVVDTNKFINDSGGVLSHLMEDDYEFLLSVRYPGRNMDSYALFQKRIINAIVGTLVLLFVLGNFLGLSAMNIGISVVVGVLLFKMPYMQLQSYYKANLNYINTMLPYYLKTLEILVQHYTVPVALSRSIESAPDVFRPGLRRLVARIEEGDSSVQPYIDFANEYPVRDSMRMMRLLYRLGLGSQQNK